MNETDEKRLNDAHCHFFSAGFFDALARDPAAPPVADPAVDLPAALGWGRAGESRSARRPLGGRARSPRRAARRPHGQRSRRRDVRRGRGRAASVPLRRPVHGEPHGAGRRGGCPARLRGARPALRLPVPRDAPFRTRRRVRHGGLSGGGRPRPRRLRPLRRAVGRRPPQARPGVALRRPARRPARGRAGRLRLPRCPGNRPATSEPASSARR